MLHSWNKRETCVPIGYELGSDEQPVRGAGLSGSVRLVPMAQPVQARPEQAFSFRYCAVERSRVGADPLPEGVDTGTIAPNNGCLFVLRSRGTKERPRPQLQGEHHARPCS